MKIIKGIRLIIYSGFILGSWISCIPQNKLIYLQDKTTSGNIVAAVKNNSYRLKAGDILYIRINAPDPDMYSLFNLDDRRMNRVRGADIGDMYMFLYGYNVNENGSIHLPVIGELHVAGLSVEEARDLVHRESARFLVDATVSVRLINFNVTVLGEVNRPGTFNIYQDEFTVMDAIGAAGDMTDYGNRKILIVRKTAEGREFARLDISTREASVSEFYYLHPNDVIYVEPMIAKRFALAQFPYAVLFTAISTVVLLINFVN